MKASSVVVSGRDRGRYVLFVQIAHDKLLLRGRAVCCFRGI